ncbi:MAG: SpvB/TcaC N-terminal domain-containing protein [Patescibacteria group bacterium]
MRNRLTALIVLVLGFFSFSIAPVFAIEAIPIPRSPYSFVGAYQTDLFTGSGNYNYPLKVPKGVNDLTPEVNLSYNSSSGYSFSSFVGNGWQINRDYIERDVNFTPANSSTGDDKFKLSLNGSVYEFPTE